MEKNDDLKERVMTAFEKLHSFPKFGMKRGDAEWQKFRQLWFEADALAEEAGRAGLEELKDWCQVECVVYVEMGLLP